LNPLNGKGCGNVAGQTCTMDYSTSKSTYCATETCLDTYYAPAAVAAGAAAAAAANASAVAAKVALAGAFSTSVYSMAWALLVQVI
jgi:hypothetical protein